MEREMGIQEARQKFSALVHEAAVHGAVTYVTNRGRRVAQLRPLVVEASAQPGNPAEPRELLGRLVRQVWVKWASEQSHPKPSWLYAWEEIDDGQREVDMRIGAALFEAGQRSVAS